MAAALLSPNPYHDSNKEQRSPFRLLHQSQWHGQIKSQSQRQRHRILQQRHRILLQLLLQLAWDGTSEQLMIWNWVVPNQRIPNVRPNASRKKKSGCASVKVTNVTRRTEGARRLATTQRKALLKNLQYRKSLQRPPKKILLPKKGAVDAERFSRQPLSKHSPQ